MYPQTQLLYILTMLEAIEKIVIYTQGIYRAEDLFWANEQQSFNACSHLLLAIGEESKKLATDLKKVYADFDWKSLAGLRDRLAHDYRGTDPEIVFSIIQEDLPILKTILVASLEQVEQAKEILPKVLNSPYYRHVTYLLND